MQIASEILDNLYDVFKTQQITHVEGTYDGLVGSVTLYFKVGSDVYPQTQEFTYTGREYVEFKEYLFQAAGVCVQRHNSEHYQEDRSEFIASVTE